MLLTLSPIHTATGTITLPGSKSLTIRALLLAALGQGTITLHHVLHSDDTQVMLNALQTLGVTVIKHLDGDSVTITGNLNIKRVINNNNQNNDLIELFVGNSGLSIRTLAALLSVLKGRYRLHGVPRMHERPIRDLVDSLKRIAHTIDYENIEGYPPLLIQGRELNVKAKIEDIVVKGNASSQYLTGLLQIAPLLSDYQAIKIKVEGELISKPYIDMTLKLMSKFGVEVLRDNSLYSEFIISQGSVYKNPSQYAIESDASSASYFLAAGALGKDAVTIQGVGFNSIQGDIQFAHFLESLGVEITWHDTYVVVKGFFNNTLNPHQFKLPAFNQNFNHIPDAAMTAAIIALFTDGRCVLKDIGSWRVKETDRLAAMTTELRKIGATVEEGEDWLAITPPIDFKTATIHTYDDHRMAMCFSLVAFAGIPISIEDPACVNKTFPTFFDEFQRICKNM